MRTRKEITEDRKLFQSEIKTSLSVIEDVMKDLWEQGMNSQQKLTAFESKLEKIQEAVVNINKDVNKEEEEVLHHPTIPCDKITCCDDSEEEVKRGQGQIVKKMYISQTVCQKEINIVSSSNQRIIERQVGILTELKNCQNIITL